MAIPTGLPLVGGADLWVLLAPVTVLSVAAGWVLSVIDKRLRVTATVGSLRSDLEDLVPQAA
jgi:hypothetical protein